MLVRQLFAVHVAMVNIHALTKSLPNNVSREANPRLEGPKAVGYIQSPHRISAGGSLLFMRCVSLTLTGLISAWGRGEASSAILAKSLSDCVTVFCLGQCKSRHLKVCGIVKRTCYFQTNGVSYILNWDVRCLCCRWRCFHTLLFWASSSNSPT